MTTLDSIKKALVGGPSEGPWTSDGQRGIDHCRSNNRWSNLRVVTSAENNLNCSQYSNNTSGVTGVSWDKQSSCWRAHIRIGRKQKSLGFFIDFDKAVATRKTAENELGFHQNHGKKSAVGGGNV